MAVHELRHVPLFDLPLGGLGGDLPLGGLHRRLLHRRGQLLLPLAGQLPVQQGSEDAVNHEIRIAADGGGEVAVVLGPQAEVAQVLPVVAGLHQGAEHHHGHGGLLRLAPGSVQQLLEGGAVGLLQIVPPRGYHGAQGLGLVGGGLLVHPVDAGLVQLVQVLGHALVGGEHEGLDQGLADPLAVHRHVHRRAGVVADHIALLGVQLQGAPPPAAALQHPGQGGHVLQHGQDVLIPLL